MRSMPGHVDFCAEAERVLPVLDCAVLVISGPSGVQAHTVTLWDLLRRYRVPTVLFVSKMDLPGADRQALMEQLQQQLIPPPPIRGLVVAGGHIRRWLVRRVSCACCAMFFEGLP